MLNWRHDSHSLLLCRTPCNVRLFVGIARRSKHDDLANRYRYSLDGRYTATRDEHRRRDVDLATGEPSGFAADCKSTADTAGADSNVEYANQYVDRRRVDDRTRTHQRSSARGDIE